MHVTGEFGEAGSGRGSVYSVTSHSSRAAAASLVCLGSGADDRGEGGGAGGTSIAIVPESETGHHLDRMDPAGSDRGGHDHGNTGEAHPGNSAPQFDAPSASRGGARAPSLNDAGPGPMSMGGAAHSGGTLQGHALPTARPNGRGASGSESWPGSLQPSTGSLRIPTGFPTGAAHVHRVALNAEPSLRNEDGLSSTSDSTPNRVTSSYPSDPPTPDQERSSVFGGAADSDSHKGSDSLSSRGGNTAFRRMKRTSSATWSLSKLGRGTSNGAGADAGQGQGEDRSHVQTGTGTGFMPRAPPVPVAFYAAPGVELAGPVLMAAFYAAPGVELAGPVLMADAGAPQCDAPASLTR